MLDSVFMVEHEFEDPPEVDNYKFIGVYSTYEKAEAVVERLKKCPGFCDFPNEFCITERDVDGRYEWRKGFVRD